MALSLDPRTALCWGTVLCWFITMIVLTWSSFFFGDLGPWKTESKLGRNGLPGARLQKPEGKCSLLLIFDKCVFKEKFVRPRSWPSRMTVPWPIPPLYWTSILQTTSWHNLSRSLRTPRRSLSGQPRTISSKLPRASFAQATWRSAMRCSLQKNASQSSNE
jgi:hypothetical protein